jgi:hypothetical protein
MQSGSILPRLRTGSTQQPEETLGVAIIIAATFINIAGRALARVSALASFSSSKNKIDLFGAPLIWLRLEKDF